jgi:PAS domain S-box-containing protein
MKPAEHIEPVRTTGELPQAADPRLRALSAAIEASEARALAVLAHGGLSVWTIDPKTGAVVGGSGWQALTGQPAAEMRGFGWMEVVHEEDRDRVGAICRGVLSSAAPRECEFRVQTREGHCRVLHFKLIAVHAADRSVREWIGISTDISHHMEVLVELHETQLKNREIRDELAHTRRITLLGTLAGSIAHELRQPLAAVMANARAARRFLERPAPEVGKAIEALDDIVRDDQRASQIIEHFRSLLKGRPSAGQPCDLNDAIAEVVTLVRSDATMRQIEIQSALDETAPAVRGDRVQLQQVVLNLLMNAFDAVLDPSAVARIVSIRTACGPDGATIVTVDDNGPPVSDEQFARMQRPFYTTKPEGLGLGLSICREILTAHASELRAERKARGGLAFSFAIAPHPE